MLTSLHIVIFMKDFNQQKCESYEKYQYIYYITYIYAVT